jgi:hypothetical protein
MLDHYHPKFPNPIIIIIIIINNNITGILMILSNPTNHLPGEEAVVRVVEVASSIFTNRMEIHYSGDRTFIVPRKQPWPLRVDKEQKNQSTSSSIFQDPAHIASNKKSLMQRVSDIVTHTPWQKKKNANKCYFRIHMSHDSNEHACLLFPLSGMVNASHLSYGCQHSHLP